jgi:hypothetical protein
MNDTWGIYRRKPEVDIHNVEDIIKKEIEEDLKGNIGYRRMTNILRLKYHLIVKRNMVLDLMNKVDPDGFVYKHPEVFNKQNCGFAKYSARSNRKLLPWHYFQNDC